MVGIYSSPLETMNYLTLNGLLVDKGIKYFEAEAINTNGNT